MPNDEGVRMRKLVTVLAAALVAGLVAVAIVAPFVLRDDPAVAARAGSACVDATSSRLPEPCG